MVNIKKFILDTSVLLYDPNSIYQFEDNEVIITSEVLCELNKNKKRNYNAREVIRQLNKDYESVNIESGTPAHNYRSNDVSIMNKADKYNGVLVTKDKHLQLLAKINDIAVEDYKNNKVENIYDGKTEINLSKSEIGSIYSKGHLEINGKGRDLIENQFIVVKSFDKDNSALCRYTNGKLKLIREKQVSDLSARNKEQMFGIDVMIDKNIDLVTITGAAGNGKSLLSIASGLELVEQNDYSKMLIARPIVGMDNELGFMPGSMEEKLIVWMQPILDNLEYLFNRNPREVINELKEFNKLELQSLEHVRGRSLPNQFMLLSEAQNLTPHEVKTVITRMGENSKLILEGDISQIDKNYLDEKSNGLSYVIDRFKGQSNYAHIEFKESERSKLAEQGASLL